MACRWLLAVSVLVGLYSHGCCAHYSKTSVTTDGSFITHETHPGKQFVTCGNLIYPAAKLFLTDAIEYVKAGATQANGYVVLNWAGPYMGSGFASANDRFVFNASMPMLADYTLYFAGRPSSSGPIMRVYVDNVLTGAFDLYQNPTLSQPKWRPVPMGTVTEGYHTIKLTAETVSAGTGWDWTGTYDHVLVVRNCP